MFELVIHTDGGARGNPGPAAIGVVLSLGTEQLLHQRYIGETTNNVAEYTAVIDALAQLPVFLKEQKIDRLHFYLDSELVVKQLLGLYRVKEPSLQQLHAEILKKLGQLQLPYQFTHVRRAENAQADSLVNQALDARLN